MAERAKQLVLVRPYGSTIQDKVAATLKSAGLSWQEAVVIDEGTPDADVAEALPRGDHWVLVIPFHAHRDEEGQVVNGVDLLEKIAQQRPDLDHCPVIMPVSAVGHAGASLRLARWETQEEGPRSRLNARVLLVKEDELGTLDAKTAIRRHIKALAPATPQAPEAEQA